MKRILTILTFVQLLISCNNSPEEKLAKYQSKPIPGNLKPDKHMKLFHTKDFYGEVREALAKNKSCVAESCTNKEEDKIFSKIGGLLMTSKNEMAWMCEGVSNMQTLLRKKDPTRKEVLPLLDHMRFCDEVAMDFIKFEIETCLKMFKRYTRWCRELGNYTKEFKIRENRIKYFAKFE